MGGDSFFISGPSQCEGYRHCRENRYKAKFRDGMDQMWQRCRPFVGEPDFREKARDDLNAFGWHLYLLDCLLARGFKVLPAGKAGPDICLLIDGQNVWIEAISVKAGTGVDKVDKPPQLHVYSPPDEKILLRHTAALKEKHDKYQSYLRGGLIAPDEPYLVALNVGLVPDTDMLWADPVSYLEQAVFGLGDEQFHVSVETGEVTGTSYKIQLEVQKPSNKATVPTQVFLGDDYRGLSGVIYCPHQVVEAYDRGGRDISLLHNPRAANRISHGALKLGREKWVEDGSLRVKTWTPR